MTWTYSFGKAQIFGIELSLFSIDPMDFETHPWEWFSIKLLFKMFGLWVHLFGLDISKDRTCIGLFNCYLAVFYG